MKKFSFEWTTLFFTLVLASATSVDKLGRPKPSSVTTTEYRCPPPFAPKNIIRESKTHWSRVNFNVPIGVPPCNIVGIYFKRVNVNTTKFFDYLKQTGNLRLLSMKQVQFLEPIESRVSLPNLQKFLLFGCGVPPNHPQMTKEELQTVIFFNKQKDVYKIDQIVQHNVTLDINCGFKTILQVIPQKRKIVSNLEFTNDILMNLKNFQVQILDLRHLPLNGSLVPINTTELRLMDVKLIERDLNGLVKGLLQLASLHIWLKAEDPNYFLYLADIPESLKSMELRNMSLRYSGEGHVVALENMTLSDCSLENSVVEEFPNVFQVREIHIDCKDNTQMHPLLFQMIKSNVTEKIWMKNFDRNATELPRYQEMEDFLTKVGVLNTRNWFQIDRLNGVWTTPPRVFNSRNVAGVDEAIL